MAQASEFNWRLAMSILSQNSIEEFIEDTPLDLDDVWVLSPKSVERLNAKGIKNTINLIGQFSTMFDEDRSTQENSNEYYLWLGEVGVASAYKNAITRLIIEKVNVLYPGTIDIKELEEHHNSMYYQ
jgi:hypothetical protein